MVIDALRPLDMPLKHYCRPCRETEMTDYENHGSSFLYPKTRTIWRTLGVCKALLTAMR